MCLLECLVGDVDVEVGVEVEDEIEVGEVEGCECWEAFMRGSGSESLLLSLPVGVGGGRLAGVERDLIDEMIKSIERMSGATEEVICTRCCELYSVLCGSMCVLGRPQRDTQALIILVVHTRFPPLSGRLASLALTNSFLLEQAAQTQPSSARATETKRTRRTRRASWQQQETAAKTEPRVAPTKEEWTETVYGWTAW